MPEPKNKLDNVIESIIALAFAAFIVVIFAQVIFRYVFNNSLTWAEEFARYIFIWFVFLAGAIGVKRGSHIEVDFFLNFLPEKVKYALKIFALLAISIFSVFIAVEGWSLAQKTWSTPSPAMRIPMGLEYLSLAVGGAVLTIYALIALKNFVTGNKTPKEGNQC